VNHRLYIHVYDSGYLTMAESGREKKNLNTAIVVSAVLGPDSSRVDVPTRRRTMPQINMIPHPVTLYWHQANQSCQMENV